MPSDTAAPTRFDPSRLPAVCARACGTAVAMASLFLFMLAMPPVAYGVWFQTEPTTVGLAAVGVAAGLSLFALDLTGHSIALLLGRRHIQVLLAFLLWNALVSAVQDFPGRSWFGTPETGQGMFSFMALAMLTLLTMALWPYRMARLAMVGAAALAALTIGGLDALLPPDSPWRPEKYAGYAGTVGPPVALIVAGAFRRAEWRMGVLAVGVGLVPVAFSGNKTAIVLLCLAAPILLAAVLLGLRGVPLPRARRILAWMPVSALLLTCATIAAAMAYGDWDPLYSVRSRGLLIWAALLGLQDRPAAWLTGFGWGSFNDVLYWHNYLPSVRGFVDGVWNPNWEGLGAGAFHVHNDVFEAVLGGGAISGGLYLTFFATIVAGARRRMLGIAAVGWFLIVGSLCFWFPFMLCFPFLALAIAATSAPASVLRSPIPVPMGGWMRFLGLAAIAVLAMGGVATWQDARTGGDRLAALGRQNPAEIPIFGRFPADRGRGGVHLWWLALNEAAFVGAHLQSGQPVTPEQAQWYGRMLDEVDTWAVAGRAGTRLRALTLALRNDLIGQYEHTALAPLRERELPRWEPAVLRLIAHAPDRTDVAVPFLAFLALTKQFSRIEGVCARIDAMHPADRVCQWYTGLARLGNPATEKAGVASMRAALAQHVDAVVPVPNTVRATIDAYRPSE